MPNGLDIPVKMPVFESLRDELVWLETQRLQSQLELKEVGQKLSNFHAGHSGEKDRLLSQHLAIKKTFNEIETKVIQCRAKIRAEKEEASRNREDDPTALIADLTGIALQILDELQEINRKLTGGA
jgi:hypothetical protein